MKHRCRDELMLARGTKESRDRSGRGAKRGSVLERSREGVLHLLIAKKKKNVASKASKRWTS
jgi:hypothetical protein